jgi:hypothetical protein
MLGTDASIVELHGLISRSINFFSLHHQDLMRFQKLKGDQQMPSLLQLRRGINMEISRPFACMLEGGDNSLLSELFRQD